MDRLSRIETMWSVVRRAHAEDVEDAKSAQHALLEQYGGAIQRYLAAVLRDPEAAEEVYQEFALKFVSGGLHSADPDRGRFRSFVKTTLFRLVADYHRKKARRGHALRTEMANQLAAGQETKNDADDEAFLRSWRDELLARSWLALQEHEQQTGKPFYTVLRLRVGAPQARSNELAEQLTEKLGRNTTAGNVRVMIHRARDAFADFLLQEVRNSLDSPEDAELEEELIHLDLLEYCKPALRRQD